MSAALEAYLVRLYLDPDARHAFLAGPRAAATAAGLPDGDVSALEQIDRVGLELAARSFAAKRLTTPRGQTSRLTRALAWWRAALSTTVQILSAPNLRARLIRSRRLPRR